MAYAGETSGRTGETNTTENQNPSEFETPGDHCAIVPSKSVKGDYSNEYDSTWQTKQKIDEHGWREEYLHKFFWFLFAWSVFAWLMTCLAYWLSDTVKITILSVTLGNVITLMITAARWLFPANSSRG